MAPWRDDIEYVLEHQVLRDERGFDDADFERLADANFSESQLREIFEDGFLTRSDDPNVDPDERQELREAFFEWMEYMGYERDDFNWQDWREYMGYD